MHCVAFQSFCYVSVSIICTLFYSVIIVLTEKAMIGQIAKVAYEKQFRPSVTWIVSDSVSHKRIPITVKRDRICFLYEGAILVQPESTSLQGFYEHFTKLILDKTNPHNPWFQEFYHQYVNCYNVSVIAC